jgi:hypothetical protein
VNRFELPSNCLQNESAELSQQSRNETIQAVEYLHGILVVFLIEFIMGVDGIAHEYPAKHKTPMNEYI